MTTNATAPIADTSDTERRALRTLALAGLRMTVTEHGVTIVAPAREDLPQTAEDALDALAAAGWTESPLPSGSGALHASPGPLRDVIHARQALATLIDAIRASLAPMRRLWDLVEAADAGRRRELAAMHHAYRIRLLARRRRNRRRNRR